MSIRLSGVTGGYAGFTAGPIDAEIHSGRFTALIGPNGCGKSTILNMIAGVLPLRAGNITIGGQDTTSAKRKDLAKVVTFLPQNPVTPPGITVEMLVHYGRAPHQNLLGMRSALDNEKVKSAMVRADVNTLGNRALSDLSGGQRQRAFIAMALAQDTPYLLLDEPTSFLDVKFQFEILELARSLADAGTTVVAVLHDIAQAARFADDLVIIRNGHVYGQGPPNDTVTPTMLREVYDFEGHVYFDPISKTSVATPSVRKAKVG